MATLGRLVLTVLDRGADIMLCLYFGVKFNKLQTAELLTELQQLVDYSSFIVPLS